MRHLDRGHNWVSFIGIVPSSPLGFTFAFAFALAGGQSDEVVEVRCLPPLRWTEPYSDPLSNAPGNRYRRIQSWVRHALVRSAESSWQALWSFSTSGVFGQRMTPLIWEVGGPRFQSSLSMRNNSLASSLARGNMFSFTFWTRLQRPLSTSAEIPMSLTVKKASPLSFHDFGNQGVAVTACVPVGIVWLLLLGPLGWSFGRWKFFFFSSTLTVSHSRSFN